MSVLGYSLNISPSQSLPSGDPPFTCAPNTRKWDTPGCPVPSLTLQEKTLHPSGTKVSLAPRPAPPRPPGPPRTTPGTPKAPPPSTPTPHPAAPWQGSRLAWTVSPSLSCWIPPSSHPLQCYGWSSCCPIEHSGLDSWIPRCPPTPWIPPSDPPSLCSAVIAVMATWLFPLLPEITAPPAPDVVRRRKWSRDRNGNEAGVQRERHVVRGAAGASCGEGCSGCVTQGAVGVSHGEGCSGRVMWQGV